MLGKVGLLMVTTSKTTTPSKATMFGYAGVSPFAAAPAQGQESCTVDGEKVRGQAVDFYNGWIEGEIVGAFKREPGSGHWK